MGAIQSGEEKGSSMSYATILVQESESVLELTLNRPEVHNAFNDELISEVISLFEDLGSRSEIRAIVLKAVGRNFCAGADLNWMSKMVAYSREENARDSSMLAKMYSVMNDSRIPIVGRIQGAAIGGGVGLVSVCDIAICEQRSKFGLSEVKLGILPAVISPYVIAKIGYSHARALFFTGERFDADRALRIGLVHKVAGSEEELDTLVEESVAELKSSGPEAVRACKRLVSHVATHSIDDSVPYTIEAIAERRISNEGQGGMTAFLEKTKAPWLSD